MRASTRLCTFRKGVTFTAAVVMAAFCASAAHSQKASPAGTGGPVPVPLGASAVTTYHNDNARTGLYPNETILTPDKVKNGYIDPTTKVKYVFGKMFARTVDGAIYAQPLYVPNVPIADLYTGAISNHNVVYVTTAHNTVYAFDADDNHDANAHALWKHNFNNSLLDVGPVSSAEVSTNDIFPEIGIIGTPVIDPDSMTLYVVVKTNEAGDYVQRLHALDLRDGSEKFGGPVAVQASVPGQGDGATTDDGVNFYVPFDTLRQNQRPALLLRNGIVYVGWGSHGDQIPYHGWLLGYDAKTLQQKFIYNVSPNALTDPSGYPLGGGAIWMAGAGPAADAKGNIYFMTGNGSFDANNKDPKLPSNDYGDSFVKLGPNTSVLDYFTPFNQNDLNNADEDLGSGGLVVLPDSVGSSAHPHLLVGAGKEGKIYLLDRDNMGKFHDGNDSQIVQSLPNAIGGAWSSPAYFNGSIYYQGTGDVLKAFPIANGQIGSPTQAGTAASDYPGSTPVISALQTATGYTNGIVWTLTPFNAPDGRPTIPQLRAYDAKDISNPLYDSLAAGQRDSAGDYTKFTVPTVANGKVYVGGDKKLTVFGMTPARASQADHFIVAGPMLFFPPILTLIEQGVGYYFSVTAVGIDGLPVPISGIVYLAYTDPVNGSLRLLGVLQFNNQSNVVFPYAFSVPGERLIEAFDLAGHTGFDAVGVVSSPQNPEGGQGGVDHLKVRAKSTARDGESITLTVQALTSDNTPVADDFFVLVYDTIPDGIPAAYESNFAIYDFGGQSQITIPRAGEPAITLHGKGKHVLVVTDIVHTGTTVVTVSGK
jgi:hypothetical protein